MGFKKMLICFIPLWDFTNKINDQSTSKSAAYEMVAIQFNLKYTVILFASEKFVFFKAKFFYKHIHIQMFSFRTEWICFIF